MNKTRLLCAIAAGSVALSAAGAASAQAWTNINERQARLEERIERGLRNGALTREEAARMRSDFNYIADLEARYRVDGLSPGERADLQRRFDELSSRIADQATDRDRGYYGGDARPGYEPPPGPGYNPGIRAPDDWGDFDDRAAELSRRIDSGRRSGRISASEASRLRADLDAAIRDANRYRTDIDRRLDTLESRFGYDRRY
ncbi:MAG: hypothetical protein ABW042_02815 [Phenylobacterium sp.]